MTIKDILAKYHKKLDFLDLELLIADAIKKPREFVLAHPEYPINSLKIENLKLKISRRRRGEPLAYILGHKEFFGLDFRVNQHALIPRPETELLVELAIQEAKSKKQETSIIDIGTGSGNIIISLAKNIKDKNNFYAIDISQEALKIAKQNSRLHKVDKKIKFLRGDLLEPILKNTDCQPQTANYIILANLPYLSKEIYNAAPTAVKKYEPRTALFSPKEGLDHYERLLKQLKEHRFMFHVSCFMEISPEQKPKLNKLIKAIFPQAKPEFIKDLAGKWRICKLEI